jgi:hypothetical protein
MRGALAFGKGDFDAAAELMRPVRALAQRFGGSHAQRDLLDLTLAEAARRAGMGPLAAGLEAQRIALRPRTRAAAPLALAA